MAMTIPGNCYQTRLRFTVTGDPEPMYMTLGVQYGEGLTDVYPTGVDGIAEKVFSAWNIGFPPTAMTLGWTALGSDAQQGGENGQVGAYSNFTTGNAGPFPPIPVNVALLVKKKTALRGRRYTGRMYLPAGAYMSPQGMSAAGVLSGDALSVIGGYLDAFQTSLTTDDQHGEGVIPVLFHSVVGETGQLPTPITDFVCDQKVATQRRRLRP